MTDDENRYVTTMANQIVNNPEFISPRSALNVAEAWLDAVTPRPLDEWSDDDGCVLWWRLPVEEPPYCGSPNCSTWHEDYYTHWIPLICPMVASDKIKKASTR